MQIIPNLKEMAGKRNTVVKIVKSNITFLSFVKMCVSAISFKLSGVHVKGILEMISLEGVDKSNHRLLQRIRLIRTLFYLRSH